MVTLKNYVCAFLACGDNMLLLKRAETRKVNPGFWSGAGGKIEPDELNDPYSACLREIREETGLVSKDISSLKLRYILLRRRENTITQSYIYFGKTSTMQVADTDEGTLHWVRKAELPQKKYTATYVQMMAHYLSGNSDEGCVFVGTAENEAGKLRMCWSRIEDFSD